MDDRALDNARMTRRDLLAGGAALLAGSACGAAGQPPAGDDAALRTLLDGLAGSAAARLRAVSGFRGTALSPRAALDLGAAREGLAIDARIEALMPFGRTGRSPYTVTPASGAWRDRHAPDAVAQVIADTAAVMREGQAGIVLPAPILDRTIAAVSAAADTAPTPLAAALRDQVAELARWRPLAGLPGMSRLPNGAACYAGLLDRQFGETRDAATVHHIFAGRLADLQTKADAALSRLGLRTGSFADRMRAAFRDPRFLYTDDAAGRDRAVADMNAVLARAKARVPALIGAVPPECLDCAAARMAPADEAAGRQGYRILPRPDGTAGRYVVDLARIAVRPGWTLPAVVHHEMVPGHMIQLPMEARAAPHPLRVAYAAGWQEGWAIHAEALMAADAAGAADDDRLQLGNIHWLLFRVARAVVDTGVHMCGWSIPEAREKLEGMMGQAAYFAPFDQEIERICVEPAVRAGEALAWLALDDAAGRHAAGSAGRHRFYGDVLQDGRLRRSQMIARAADRGIH